MTKDQKPKIGIALGGGAGLGWAHIGVIRVLEAEGIPIHMVAGTSIGSIVGACLASGKMDHLEDLARSFTFKQMMKLSQWGFGDGALIGNGKIEAILRDYFGTDTFEHMKLPFACIAADLYAGERVEITSGDVATALMASSAVPGVLPPMPYKGTLLVDGGVVDPLPVQSLREMGADRIIAIDLQADYVNRVKELGFGPGLKPRGRVMKSARAALFLMMTRIGQERLKVYKPDIIIAPKVGHIEMANFTKADELIAIGTEATKKALPEIKEALNIV